MTYSVLLCEHHQESDVLEKSDKATFHYVQRVKDQTKRFSKAYENSQTTAKSCVG